MEVPRARRSREVRALRCACAQNIMDPFRSKSGFKLTALKPLHMRCEWSRRARPGSRLPARRRDRRVFVVAGDLRIFLFRFPRTPSKASIPYALVSRHCVLLQPYWRWTVRLRVLGTYYHVRFKGSSEGHPFTIATTRSNDSKNIMPGCSIQVNTQRVQP